MRERFHGKVALVTGAGTGIGRAIAQRLAAEGADVVIVGRTEATLVEVANDRENITFVAADICEQEEVRLLVAEVLRRHGTIDVVVNNAGVSNLTAVAETDLLELDWIFDLNVRGLVDLTLATLPAIKAAKGNIVNVASSILRRAVPLMSIYAASKGAVASYSRALAKELGRDGVRVNVVNPGAIETAMHDRNTPSDTAMEAHLAGLVRMTSLDRLGSPDEVAAAVAFIASDEASFITGAELAVDGGQSL
jgi:NAD(P)-dependent dehydrogenase (short-subunit alcohol dehydrogenase family)